MSNHQVPKENFAPSRCLCWLSPIIRLKQVGITHIINQSQPVHQSINQPINQSMIHTSAKSMEAVTIYKKPPSILFTGTVHATRDCWWTNSLVYLFTYQVTELHMPNFPPRKFKLYFASMYRPFIKLYSTPEN
jgi:hypothetical protein